MIYLYSGTPGSGKSLNTARQIYDALKNTRKLVITNFPINSSYIRKPSGDLMCLENYQITPQLLKQLSYDHFKNRKKVKEGDIILVLDEAELIFNSREWQRTDRREWLSFFNLHRHFGYDVILIAQYDRMLDRQIRCNIEYELVHRKCSNFGIKGKLFSFFAFGQLHVCKKVWYPLKESVGAEFFRAKKKYYRLYDSYAHFAAEQMEQVEEPVSAEQSPAAHPAPEVQPEEPEEELPFTLESDPDQVPEEISEPDTPAAAAAQEPKQILFFQQLWKKLNNGYIYLRFIAGRKK